MAKTNGLLALIVLLENVKLFFKQKAFLENTMRRN